MVGVAIAKGRMQTDRCRRCGGLMVEEQVYEIGTIDWRCISCGERIDTVILAHRHDNVVRVEAEKLFSGKSKTRLN